MRPASTIANSLWLAANLPMWKRFEAALCRPAETQEAILQRLLARNARSAYGYAFGFSELKNYEQFSARVPLTDYADLQPWINRILKGETSVLTLESATHLLPTSGSSGGRKLIPFTGSLQKEINAAVGPWIVDLFLHQPSLLAGTAYWSISPMLPKSESENSAVPIGFDDDSGYLGGFHRRLVESTFAVPAAVRLIPEMDNFRYITLLFLLRNADLSLVSVWHPTFFTLLLDAMSDWWEELLTDLERGECLRADHLPIQVKTLLGSQPRRERYNELKGAGSANIARIWPKLTLVSCWGDAQASSAMAELENRLPGTSIQPKGLLATEGVISIPFQGQHPLAVRSHFYEFEDEAGRIRLAHDLELGKTYSVILTTGGGFWRYRLGDLVEIKDFIGETPSLRFVGRCGNVSDVCGEKLAEAFVTQAIQNACQLHGFNPRFVLLAPNGETENVRNYLLFLEGEPPEGFLPSLESELRNNPHYALCRDLGQLGEIQLVPISRDGHARYIQRCLANGQKLGDIKPSALSRRSDWAEVFMF